MAFLIADRVEKLDNGLVINRKIIPNSLKADKYVASWCKEGQPMKPCKKLSGGTGIPKGITVHNTADIKEAKGTNDAEQYARATYNGNMSGVVVHFYVYENHIWQLLEENERGWHATDGSTRRKSQRGDGSTIGGNLDTIAIECIGNNKKSEDTTAKLVAYLCEKHNLNVDTDVYQHNYFYPSKNCPEYIRPHWADFMADIKKYYEGKEEPEEEPKVEYFKQYKGKSKSIVDSLKSLGYSSSYSYRKKIAKANNIKFYIGSAKQNVEMLTLLKRGKLIKP